MKKNVTGLANVAKKPGKYVVDIDELKSQIQNKTESGKNSANNPVVKKELIQEKSVAPKIAANPQAIQQIVGLHIPITIVLRDKLKVKAVEEGKKMKALVAEIIEGYLK